MSRIKTIEILRGPLADAITSAEINRIVVSADPNTPITDGDLLLVYQAPDTFSTDFSSGLTGWTPRWNETTSWTAEADGTATGGMVVSMDSVAAGRKALTMDAADAIASADVEVVGRIKSDGGSAVSSAHGGLIVRSSGDTASANNYMIVIYANQARISRTVSGSFSDLVTTPIAIGDEAWYWARLRVVGDQLSAKVWLDGDPEPGAWMLTTSDTALTAPGWCGLFASSAVKQWWDVFGVAFDGATATVPGS